MNEAERANVNHIAKWDKTSWDNIYNWDGDITIKGDFIKSENGDDEMTDISIMKEVSDIMRTTAMAIDEIKGILGERLDRISILEERVAKLEAGNSNGHDNDGDKQLVDVGKLIFSGDWELIEQNGLIYLTKHGYGIKIVLSLQNAKEVWRMLDAYMERRAYEWAASYGSAPGGKE
jgi:hypothetical protein